MGSTSTTIFPPVIFSISFVINPMYFSLPNIFGTLVRIVVKPIEEKKNAFKIVLSFNPPEIVIAPDRRKDGTNPLFLSPANLITFGYGPGSYQKHLTSAEQKGARVHIFEKMSLELDLDLPEDLELLKSLETSKPF